jgi:hypothetical protein
MADLTTVLLREAWGALGGAADRLELVEVTGDGAGLLPSTLPALPAMVAAVATSTLAASVLTAARCGSGPGQAVVDAAHVAVAARSERHAREVGVAGARLFAPLSRFWRTADGWLRLHANYSWHRERALRVLGCEDRPEAVGEAVLGWRAEELEDTLAAAGAIGYAVRSPAEWRSHPHGRAVAALPLLDSTVGRGAGRSIGGARGARGVRVLDLTRVIAGPVATRTLAAWGAELQSCGAGDREPARTARPEDYVIELSGVGRPVQVVGPPGRAGDLLPQWSSTTVLGGDPPTFSDRPGAV